MSGKLGYPVEIKMLWPIRVADIGTSHDSMLPPCVCSGTCTSYCTYAMVPIDWKRHSPLLQLFSASNGT